MARPPDNQQLNISPKITDQSIPNQHPGKQHIASRTQAALYALWKGLASL